ncbi:MAG: protein translocase subunit SecD [Sandaracinaceae bacterium]|nr:protein translocase subunit SecD [Sandaracinaceae bacterium]
MERSWYFRFALVLIAAIGGWMVLWPSLSGLQAPGAATCTYDASAPGRCRGENCCPSGQECRVDGHCGAPHQWYEAPDFLARLVPNRISPGLDIRGGLRLMYEVEVDEAVRDRRDARAQQLLERLGNEMHGENDEPLIPEDEPPTREQLEAVRARARVQAVQNEDRMIRVTFQNDADARLLDRSLIERFGDVREVGREGRVVTLTLTAESLERLEEDSVDQARETIENRIDELGLREAAVMKRDRDVIVEVPGADQATFDRIRELISRTARLEFKVVDDDATFVEGLRADVPEGIQSSMDSGDFEGAPSGYLFAEGPGACPEGVTPDAPDGQCRALTRMMAYIESLQRSDRIPDGRQLTIGRFDTGEAPAAGQEADAWRTYFLFDRAEVTGDDLEDAFVSSDPQDGRPEVSFRMNPSGANDMARLTGSNVRRRMAIVLDDRVQSAPVIQSRISSQGRITLGSYGDFNTQQNEARDLVVVLRAGALPATIRPQNEQLIGPTLGQDSVARGTWGALLGIALVLIFMAFYYQVAGLVADLMVSLNVLLLLAVFAAFGATLTLPGIAGIALTVGMAVDANVLINERMREELRMGKSARAAVDQGFRRAFWSIFDSQFTTFIAALVLYQFGTGPIRGFALTLIIGIVTSLFTGVFCSKVMFDWIVRGLKVQRLRVG